MIYEAEGLRNVILVFNNFSPAFKMLFTMMVCKNDYSSTWHNLIKSQKIEVVGGGGGGRREREEKGTDIENKKKIEDANEKL